ncbi:MAG: glycosyltransferase family 2 protein [Ferruginibacter sp.]|nr:glycosyltransferase family 2 protein [Ferruginibacter sp.]
MNTVSVVIITFNEEQNIRRCIESVKPVADEVIVIDSFSDDGTVEIALSLGAKVKQSTFNGYINQKNKAINEASCNYVLLLDADEFLSDELAASILKEKKHFKYKAYAMKRCNIFRGSYIRHGLWYPDRKLRLFDKRYGYCGGLNPHDRILMKEPAKVKLLEGDMFHHTFKNIEEYRRRNNEVSTIMAQSLFDAGIKRSRVKIMVSPLWSFINGYFLRLGFLEGYNGLIIAMLTAQQSFSKYQKLRQLQRQQISEVAWE